MSMPIIAEALVTPASMTADNHSAFASSASTSAGGQFCFVVKGHGALLFDVEGRSGAVDVESQISESTSVRNGARPLVLRRWAAQMS